MPSKSVPVVFSFEALDRVSEPLKRLNKQLEGIRAPINRFNSQLNRFSRFSGLKSVSEGFKGVGENVSNLADKTFLLGAKFAALGFAGYFAFQKLVTATVDTNSKLSELAERTGVSSDALQRWRFVAEQTGASSESLDESFIKFSKTLSDARRGTGELVAMLGKDSHFITQLTGLKTTEAAYELFIRQLGKVPDAADAVKLGLAGMGKGADELINMSKLSDEERNKLMALRDSIGLVSKEQLEAFRRFGDLQKLIGNRLDFIKTQIVSKFMPVFENLANRFDAWITTNQPALEAIAQQFADRLPGAIEAALGAFQNLMSVLSPLFSLVGWIAESTNRLTVAFAGIGLIISSSVLVAMAALVKSVYLLGVALTTTPFGWVILGLTALAGAAFLVWKYWDNIKSAVLGAYEAIKQFLSVRIPGFANIFGSPGAAAKANGPSITSPAVAPQSSATQGGGQSVVRVLFDGVPKGVRVNTEKSQGVDLGVEVGMAMGATF